MRPQTPLLLAALLLASFAPAHADSAVTLRVDATDTARRILHVRETLPVKPGAYAISYPKWLPGEHAPTGPVSEVTNMFLEAGGKRLAWWRDDVDMNTVRVTIPAGVTSLDLKFDFLLTSNTGGYSSASSSTENLLLLSWNQVLFSPAGVPSDRVNFDASLVLPAGWKQATALPVRRAEGTSVEFGTVSLTTLVDSPVLCGRWFRSIDISPKEGPPYTIDLACDGPEGLAMGDSVIAKFRNLPPEAHAWFGGWHHGPYHFLVTLSEYTSHFGLEHHESSDDRVAERTFIDDDLRLNESTLLTHELSHSWNGKYRRPAGLATGDFSTPMKDELLWVYEGLTQYSGVILASRTGIRTIDQGLEDLARDAAELDAIRGREWRPLIDTAVEAQLLYEARNEWANSRRGVDFYDEGTLLWLDADVTIRRLTNGAKSLDDFCHAFHGGKGGPELKPYTRDDVVRTLNSVVAYDWAGFLHDRVDVVQPHPPTNGITDGGWRLTWREQPSSIQRASETANKRIDETYTIGVVLLDDGGVRDIVPGAPADRAGVAPGMKLLGVNGRRWSKELLRDAIRDTKDGRKLELLFENNDTFRTFTLDYSGGLRYPALERIPGKPDLLTPILSAHAH